MDQNMPVDMGSANGYAASNSGSGGDLSPLHQFQMLNNLNPDKKQTKDGQPAKRRGPKPDSKPALTRRQELNRQAQRTHRERKEMYIKALEQEVLRLKEVFSDSTRERDRVQQENSRLKALLAQHGISYDLGDSPIKFKRSESTYGASSSGSISGSYPPPPASESTERSPLSPNGAAAMSHQAPPTSFGMLPNNNVDYDQVGIDFVLTLERPCMDHMQYLVVRSHNSEEQEFHHPAENPDDREHEHMSGHALMATCPPHSHVMNNPNTPYPFQMPDLDKAGLTKLLDLSARLPLNPESEITPIMAWTIIYRHPRVRELNTADFERITIDLGAKVRCYGFGAVLEEFEVRDAFGAALLAKENSAVPRMQTASTAAEIAV